MTPNKKPVITDAAHSSAQTLQNPRKYVSRTGRDGTTSRDGNVSGTVKGPVLIGGTTVSLTITGNQEIVSIHGSTDSIKVGDTQKFDASIDGKFSENDDSTPNFRKVF